MPKVVPGYKEKAKSAILETAAVVFAQKGYHEATMDDVAGKLGVSKGAVYQYFSSKDDLFVELCGSAAKVLEEMLRSTFAGQRLREAAENYIDMELDRSARGRVLMFQALAEVPRNPAVNKVVKDNYVACLFLITRFLDALKDAGKLRRDMDSDSVAKFLMALRHGVLVSVQQGLDRAEAKKVWTNGFDSIMSGFLIA